MTMKIKVITSTEEYKEALALIEELMDANPNPDSEAGEKLGLLAALVRDYESSAFPDSFPDPIDAILFRMEQQGLKPRDLIPFIGSRSKVSEILSRKRPLTLNMMRALETGLGIPAKVLLKESDEFGSQDDITWSRFPVKEMAKRGYFGDNSLSNSNVRVLMEGFFGKVGSPSQLIGMLRKSNYIRSSRPMDKKSLAAWSGAILEKANKTKYLSVYKKGTVDLAFMQSIAKLSVEPNGPNLVESFLANYGIGFAIEPHFSQTYLDGATIMTNKKHPVIGLTIRHDRIDNFWFTLMHELAHISLHFDEPINLFYDDLDDADSNNTQEQAADALAREALVPAIKWQNSPARLIPSEDEARILASDIGVHIAIIAGIMRHQNNRYRYLNTLVGIGEIRKLFPDIKWKNQYV